MRQDSATIPQRIDAGFWTLSFPLRFFGLNLGRRVCLVRLSDGRLVIHSTGLFQPEHRSKFEEIGKPALMLDATTMHDTFTREACRIFPDTTYLFPAEFSGRLPHADVRILDELDARTQSELQVLPVQGTRLFTEYAVFHPASRTLILCDLLFNLVNASGYTRWVMRHLFGVKVWPAIDRPVRMAVRDREAFVRSLSKILKWDFDRIVVAHGSIIETNGQQIFSAAIRRAGFDV